MIFTGLLLSVTIIITLLIPSNTIDATRSSDDEKDERKKKRIIRLALLRPFGTEQISSISDSFVDWNNYLPCDLKHKNNSDEEVIVDIFLSFSQSYGNNLNAQASAEKMLGLFLSNRNTEKEGWARCFRNIHLIEANIPPSKDLYLPTEANTNELWVNGPNQQYLSSMEQIMKNNEERYDAVLLLEYDCAPIKQFWLDTFVAEAETGDSFAILGR